MIIAKRRHARCHYSRGRGCSCSPASGTMYHAKRNTAHAKAIINRRRPTGYVELANCDCSLCRGVFPPAPSPSLPTAPRSLPFFPRNVSTTPVHEGSPLARNAAVAISCRGDFLTAARSATRGTYRAGRRPALNQLVGQVITFICCAVATLRTALLTRHAQHECHFLSAVKGRTRAYA